MAIIARKGITARPVEAKSEHSTAAGDVVDVNIIDSNTVQLDTKTNTDGNISFKLKAPNTGITSLFTDESEVRGDVELLTHVLNNHLEASWKLDDEEKTVELEVGNKDLVENITLTTTTPDLIEVSETTLPLKPNERIWNIAATGGGGGGSVNDVVIENSSTITASKSTADGVITFGLNGVNMLQRAPSVISLSATMDTLQSAINGLPADISKQAVIGVSGAATGNKTYSFSNILIGVLILEFDLSSYQDGMITMQSLNPGVILYIRSLSAKGLKLLGDRYYCMLNLCRDLQTLSVGGGGYLEAESQVDLSNLVDYGLTVGHTCKAFFGPGTGFPALTPSAQIMSVGGGAYVVFSDYPIQSININNPNGSAEVIANGNLILPVVNGGGGGGDITGIKANSTPFQIGTDGVVDLGYQASTISLNGATINPTTGTGEVQLGNLATVDRRDAATYSFSWAQVEAGTAWTSMPNIIASNTTTITITGQSDANKAYVLNIPSTFPTKSGGKLTVSEDNAYNKGNFTISGAIGGAVYIDTLECRQLVVSETFGGQWLCLNNIDFNGSTSIASNFYALYTPAYVYAYTAVFPSSPRGLVSATTGCRFFFDAPIPAEFLNVVPGTKYITVSKGACVYINQTWNIDASNITNDGSGTVIVHGKQIVPTF